MKDNPEKKLERANLAAHAQFILGQLAPTLDEERRNVIERMKMNARNGAATGTSLLCDVAVLLAYDEIENNLSAKIRSGGKAAKEILDG